MTSLTLQPISQVAGDVFLPGSKSISNRILLLASLARGKTVINNLLNSEDVEYMLGALLGMGVEYQISSDKRTCTVLGCDGLLGGVEQPLYLGNAGTAMRSLSAALCFGTGSYEVTGDPRMLERPIKDLVEALRSAGADIDYLGEEGYPPLKIQSGPLTSNTISIRANISSQFLTALLIALPLTGEEMIIEVDGELVSAPYIDLTLSLMKDFGVDVINENHKRYIIGAGQKYISPGQVSVEGDASSASYFLAAGAIAGGKVRVHGVGSDSIQGDKEFARVLEKMGATVDYAPTHIDVSNDGPLTGVDLDLNHIPDAAMTIAVAALFARGTTTIRNIYNWRVKECDRLSAMATELRKIGAEVVEGEDYISVTPPDTLQHACIDTYDDHRMAMCFSLVALGKTAVTINDPGCVRKTFPEYFQLFETICQ